MNYELCKKLEEAGYKFKDFIVDEYIGVDKEDGGWIKPTLSELIEACGDKFVSLTQDWTNNHWYCEAKGVTRVIWGGTSEEAVAKLWLALNKK